MYQQAAANNNPALLSFTRGERGTQQRRHVPATTAALGVATLPADKHKSNVFHRGGQHVAFRRLLVLLGDDQCVAVDRLAPSLVYLLDCRDEHDGQDLNLWAVGAETDTKDMFKDSFEKVQRRRFLMVKRERDLLSAAHRLVDVLVELA